MSARESYLQSQYNITKEEADSIKDTHLEPLQHIFLSDLPNVRVNLHHRTTFCESKKRLAERKQLHIKAAVYQE